MSLNTNIPTNTNVRNELYIINKVYITNNERVNNKPTKTYILISSKAKKLLNAIKNYFTIHLFCFISLVYFLKIK